MSQNAKKEITELRRKLKAHGIECKQLPNGHWRTDSDPPLTFSFSPSDANAARAAYRDVRKRLGIDLRQSAKRKDSTNDFAMSRLRERTLKQMERGASIADLARLTVAESEDKRIGGWSSLNAAEVGISGVLRGNRLVKKNHDSLAAAVGKLEHADPSAFEAHLDKVADRFDKRRVPKHVEPPVEPTPVEQAARSALASLAEPSEPLSEEEWRDLKADIREAASPLVPTRIDSGLIADGNGSSFPAIAVPAGIEISVKIGLDEPTLALLAKLLPS